MNLRTIPLCLISLVSCSTAPGNTNTTVDSSERVDSKPSVRADLQAIDDKCGGGTEYFPDADHDGYGDIMAEEACVPVIGYVDNFLDCADQDPRAYFGQTEHFTTPVVGPVVGPEEIGRWDFNCSLSVEELIPRENYIRPTCNS